MSSALGDRPRPAVAVLTERADLPLLEWLAQERPDSRVQRLARAELEQLHVQLLALGRPDAVVDLLGGRFAVRRLRHLVFHLPPDGVWVAALGTGSAEATALITEVADLRRSGVHPPSLSDRRPSAVRHAHAFAASVELSRHGRFLLAVNRTAALGKLREEEADTYLTRRPTAGQVMTTLPGGQAAAGRVRVSDPSVRARLPASYSSAEVSLRRYRDVLCRPRQIAVQGHVLLPDTFRHHTKRRLWHPRLVGWGPLFVRDSDAVAEPLPGSYYYLDNVNRGHFGHALTEQVSHLWGWRIAKERDPSLRALVLERPGFPVAAWELDLLEAGGVERADLHVASGPVRVDTLVSGSPMFVMNGVLHPALRGTYDQIGRRLAAASSARQWPLRLFLTRRSRRRTCHNAEEVEIWFRSAGFEVVLPEQLSLADQARLVREAEVIGGFAGSGMFTIALAGAPKHVITVGSESYTASNEHMLAALLGHRLDVVLCRADVPRGDRFSEESYHSDFTFDPDREGVFLRQVLDGLVG